MDVHHVRARPRLVDAATPACFNLYGYFRETCCSHEPAGFLQSGHNVRLHKSLQLKVASLGPEVVKPSAPSRRFGVEQ